MYVFQPGSGFNGLCVKVQAGFEMSTATDESLFNSGYSNVSSNTFVDLVLELETSVSLDEVSTQIVEPTPIQR